MKDSDESSSKKGRRGHEESLTGREFLKLYKSTGIRLSEDTLREIEELKKNDSFPRDKHEQP